MSVSHAEAWPGLRASINGLSVSIDTTFSRNASNRGRLGEDFAGRGFISVLARVRYLSAAAHMATKGLTRQLFEKHARRLMGEDWLFAEDRSVP